MLKLFGNSETTNVFAYGTLNDDERLRDLLRMDEVDFAKIEKYPAVLHNFQKHQVADAHYPAIVHKEGAKVEGFIIQCIPPQCIEYLDAYEAEGWLYNRKVVAVDVQHKDVRVNLGAYTYVWAKGQGELGEVVP